MFGAAHYVAMLKLKRGEKNALHGVAATLVGHVTPYFEIVEIGTDPKTGVKRTLAQHLKTAFKDLGPSVSRFPQYFLDVHEIADAGPQGAQEAFTQASNVGVPFTPVTGIARSVDVAAAIAHANGGLGLRITRPEFEAGHLATDLPRFLRDHAFGPDRIDIILDLGDVYQMVPGGVGRLGRQFLAVIPHPNAWRTMSIVSSAFTKSMGIVDRFSHGLVERVDWQAWCRSIYSKRTTIARLPTFGDYGIQHPSGVEGFNPKIMRASSAIRYTLDQEWLLIKGESTDATRATLQFPQLARKLVSGAHKPHFSGAKHCDGCAGIQLAATGAPSYGSPEKWRQLGTIHHITNTVAQIRALPWP